MNGQPRKRHSHTLKNNIKKRLETLNAFPALLYECFV